MLPIEVARLAQGDEYCSTSVSGGFLRDTKGLIKLQSVHQSRTLDPIHVASVFDLLTGLRRSELLALDWADINLVDGTVFVHRAQTKRLHKTYGWKENKRPKSRQVIPLSPFLLNLMQRYAGTNPHGLVFGLDGDPYALWKIDSFSKAFKRHMKAIEVNAGDGTPIQTLRHIFNSLGSLPALRISSAPASWST